MEDQKNRNRAVLIITAIITLVFINAGIFYTSQIARQANEPVVDSAATVLTPITLNKDVLNQLRSRTAVLVDDKLKAGSEGRANPFTMP